MLKRLLTLALVAVLAHVAVIPAAANTPAEKVKETGLAAKVREGVARLGVGPQARVKVKLHDRTKLEGYVAEAREDYFVVADAKTGATVSVPYPNVKQVQGNNLSTKAKVAIGVGIAVGVIITIAIINAALDDG